MCLDAIGIVSKNLVKSVEFYKLLNIELKEQGGPDHLEGVTKSGLRIMVDSVKLVKKLNSNWSPSKGNAITLCFKQKNSLEVDKLYNTLVEAGFSSVTAPWDAFWGQRYCSVLDPDSNQIDLFSPL